MIQLLAPFSLLYAAVTRCRNAWYSAIPSATHLAAIPVISVGNITTGGTGKTPLVIEIASRLLARGRKPAILTRGYGGTAEVMADEVLEFQTALPSVPVVVDGDRVRGAQFALNRHQADCVVLDDGFQHRRLRRDLDIVVIDALNPWGGGRLLPAGRLRESLAGVARADLLIVSRANLVEPVALDAILTRLETLAPRKPVRKAKTLPAGLFQENGHAVSLAQREQTRVLPVCAIGNPQSFVALLPAVLPNLAPPLIFPDHHRYTPADAAAVAAAARQNNAAAVVTTRKDWVKLAALMPHSVPAIPLWRLDMRLEIEDPDRVFDGLLRSAVGRKPQATV